MPKENLILSKDFLDFDIFAVPEEDSANFVLPESQTFNTLVVYDSEAVDKELSIFLNNILAAAKLDITKDVHTLSLTKEAGFSFIRFQSKAAVDKAILFGVGPKDLGINLDLKLYQPMPFQGCTFVLADALSHIKSDTSKKKALWTCLQEIYLS